MRLERVTIPVAAAELEGVTAALGGVGLPVSKLGQSDVCIWVGATALVFGTGTAGVEIAIAVDSLDEIAERMVERNIPAQRHRARVSSLFGLMRKAEPFESLVPPPLAGTSHRLRPLCWDADKSASPGKPNADERGIVAISGVELGVPDMAAVFMGVRAVAGMAMQVHGNRLQVGLDGTVLAFVAGQNGVVLTLEATDLSRVCPPLRLAADVELRILPA